MRGRYLGLLMTVAVVVAAVDAAASLALAQAPQIVRPPARIEGKPNFSGIWQANNEANWDLQAHAARPAAITQQGIYPYEYARVPAAPVLALGAAGAVPGSLGVVQGGVGLAVDLPAPALSLGAPLRPVGGVPHRGRGDAHDHQQAGHQQGQQDPVGPRHPPRARLHRPGAVARTQPRRHPGVRPGRLAAQRLLGAVDEER